MGALGVQQSDHQSVSHSVHSRFPFRVRAKTTQPLTCTYHHEEAICYSTDVLFLQNTNTRNPRERVKCKFRQRDDEGLLV